MKIFWRKIKGLFTSIINRRLHYNAYICKLSNKIDSEDIED